MRLQDSRAAANDIACADGGPVTSRGVVRTSDANLVQFETALRPLSRGIARQGFSLRNLVFRTTLEVALVGVCEVAVVVALALRSVRASAGAGLDDWPSAEVE